MKRPKTDRSDARDARSQAKRRGEMGHRPAIQALHPHPHGIEAGRSWGVKTDMEVDGSLAPLGI